MGGILPTHRRCASQPPIRKNPLVVAGVICQDSLRYEGVLFGIEFSYIKPNMKKIITICLLAAFAVATNLNLVAADKPAPAEKGEKKAPRSLPFRGKIEAVDKVAKTIKVGERTFHITSTTKLAKAGKPAILEDAAVGEEVGGAYREGDGGRMELVSLRIGAKPTDKKKQE